MRCLVLIAAMAALLLVGCGGHPTPPSRVVSPPATPFACHPKVPAQAGECIKQELLAEGILPSASKFGGALAVLAPRCVDISNWQGIPNFSEAKRAGVRCVIVQANDGAFRNSFFALQVSAIKAAALPWGVYSFIEGFSGAAQANTAEEMSAGRGRTLGIWADSEQSSAYPQTCSYVDRAAQFAHIYGQYGSPGTSRSGHCRGYDWPAEWGGGAAYPLPGYSSSATILRQRCGTCRLAGFSGEVDVDEALGILTLAHPAPSKTQLKAELYADYRLRSTLRNLLTKRRCRTTHPTHGYAHTCRVWLDQGAAVNKAIRQLHKAGVY
jgi:Glycosyl hydrolases family 25